ncbi:MAG: M91 family zinc metallopeptidase [Flavobacteriaceae bacterium]|nr:M91 family zinc metallopeptidase [Flavobacteriaceae bacterium]
MPERQIRTKKKKTIQIKLHVEDLVINLLDYQHSVTQGTDYTGRPSSKPVVQPIGFSYETVKNDPFLEKLVNARMSDYLKFVISPVSMNGKSTIVEIRDFYVIECSEKFDSTSNKPMTTYVTISFATIIVNAQIMDVKYWKVNDPYTKNIPITINRNEEEQEETKTPTFIDFNWIDDHDNKKIEVEEFNETIRVFIKVKDIDLGEKVALKLYAKSNGDFELLKYKEYQAEVVKKLGNTYAFCKIVLDKSWKINKPNPKNNNIDTLYIKATYKTLHKDFTNNGLSIVTKKLKGIFLEKGNDKAYYYLGKLYSATQDKKGMIPYDKKPRRQFRETKEALDLIYTKPIGKKFIDDICKRSNPNFIEITRKKGKNSTSNKTVSWLPGDNFGGLDVNGNTKRKPFLALAHELWHAWENWTDPNMLNPIWILKSPKSEESKHQELTASQFENKIRVEHNIPKRKWYSYFEEEDGTKTPFGQIF